MHCPNCQHLIPTSFWSFPRRYLACSNCDTPLLLTLGRGSRLAYFTMVFFFAFMFLLFLIPGIFILVGSFKGVDSAPLPPASAWLASAFIFMLLGRWLLGRFKLDRGDYIQTVDAPSEVTRIVNSISYALVGLVAGFFLALPVFSIWGFNKQVTLVLSAACGPEPHGYNDLCMKTASMALMAGAEIDYGDPELGWPTPLNVALKVNNRPMVMLLLDQGADINSNKNDRYPIFSTLRNPELFHLLLEHGARTDVLDTMGHNVLHEAAYFDEYTIILHLVDEGNDPNHPDRRGVTPLMVGAQYWPAALFQEVVKRGGNLNLIDHKGRSVIHQAARNRHPKVLKWLATKNLHLDSPDNTGRTPLFFAVGWGRIENARLLLSHNASADAMSLSGSTPLFDAVERQDAEMIQLLLQHKANIERANRFGWTSLHWAAYGKLKKKNRRKFSTDALAILLSYGANVHARGTAPTLSTGPKALERGPTGEFKPLIKDWTPLHVAARFGFTEGVRLLIGAKADPNAMTRNGETPLGLARKNGHLETVALLIARGAQPDLARSQ